MNGLPAVMDQVAPGALAGARPIMLNSKDDE
jgi:hypothetical protein